MEISRKLESLGIILERQREDEEGFTVLHILTEISVELERLASHVEETSIWQAAKVGEKP